MVCYSLFILSLLLVTTFSEGNNCTVGSVYEENMDDKVDGSFKDWWYLNLKKPSTCSGILIHYNLSYYSIDSDKKYKANVAMWAPVDNDTYEVVHDSFSKLSQQFDGSSYSWTLSDRDPIFIVKGSVVGAYLHSKRPLPVIGQHPDPLQDKGVCKTGADLKEPAIAVTVDCPGESIEEDNLLHFEAEIEIVDCGHLTTPDNGIINYNDTQYGAIAQYGCETGYELIGNKYLTCLGNGSWNGSIPECNILICDDPGIPDNGQRTGDNFTYQSNVTYSCDSGYELIGDATITCETDALWNPPTPTCQLVDCGDPGILENGERSGETFTYQSNVTYSCDSGYELIGDTTITCEADALWNPPTPTCQLVDCGDPGIPNNGQRTGDNFTYESIVSYSCDSGYELIGDTTIICEADALWNPPTPTCQLVDCGDPGIPNNGQRTGDNFTYESIVSYSCDSGYELIGDATIKCKEDALWNTPIPTCQLVNCGDPGILENGERSGENFTYQSNVTYSCDSGYELIGNTTITCEADALWNPPTPTCQLVDCGDPGIPNNGQRTGDNFTYESIVSYSCDSGYELIGDTTIICKEDNLWNTSIPTCDPVKCGDPGTPNNADAIGDVYTYNSEVTFNCNAGYELEGSATISCQANGSWNDAIPQCLPVSCGSPGIPTNGSIIGDIFTYQSTITYMCDNTFHLDGSSSSTCKPDKQWSHEPPTCLKICSDPGIPINGERKPSVSNITEGIIFTYTCNPGYLLSGDMAILCGSDGNWNGSLPQCIGHDPNSTSDATPAGNDSIPFSLQISVIIGASLFSIILLGSIVFLIIFYMKKRTKKRKYNLKSSHGIDNPMMHVPELYDAVPSTTNGQVLPNHIPLEMLNKQPLSIKDASLYEIPLQTIKRTTGEQTGNINMNDSSIHETVFDDNYEDCTAELPPPITIEDIENFSETDNHDGMNNETNPPITSLEIDELGGINNDIYLTNPSITSEEIEEYSEIDELGGINNDIYLSNPPITSYGIEKYSEFNKLGDISKVNPPIVSEGFEKSSEFDELGGFNNELYIANFEVNKPSRSQSIYVLPATNEDLLYAQLMRCNISKLPEAKIHLGESIGSGYFGNVYKAKMEQGDKDDDNNGIEVAVKTLQKEANQQEKIKFLQEAALMAQFHHTNVLKIIGVVAENNTCMIVTELMSKGDLQKLLNKMRPDPGELISSDTPFILLNFCRQICLGMTYLSGKGFVHRDLAARNILVSADNICKVADFGMSRDLEEENYYLAKEGAKIPIKWTAPEALNYRKYSTASDVWSFGCLMYEVWSMGCKPFMEMTNFEAFEKISAGYRLPPSPGCPKLFYELMIKCWHPDPKKRPNFNDIMLVLLQQDQTILNIPEEDLSTHPQAGILGSNLNAGGNMYKMLQNTYITS